METDTLGCQGSDCSVISCSCDSKFCGILTPCLSVSLSLSSFLALWEWRRNFPSYVSEQITADLWVVPSRQLVSSLVKEEWHNVHFFPSFNIKKAIHLFIYHQQNSLSSSKFCVSFHRRQLVPSVFDKSVLLENAIISKKRTLMWCLCLSLWILGPDQGKVHQASEKFTAAISLIFFT